MTATDHSDQSSPDESASAATPTRAPQPTTGRYSTKAVLAVLLGAIALLTALAVPLIAVLAAVSAVILGHLAVVESRSTGDRGRNLAIAGLVLGYLTLTAGLLLVLSAVSTGARITDQFNEAPDACTSRTGDFTQKQLQRCFDQTDQ